MPSILSGLAGCESPELGGDVTVYTLEDLLDLELQLILNIEQTHLLCAWQA